MKQSAFWFVCAGQCTLLAILAGCAAFQKAAPALVPSADQIACGINEAENGNDDPTSVLLKCGFEKNALDFVTRLIVGQKKAKAVRLAAQRPDGGTPDAGSDGAAK